MDRFVLCVDSLYSSRVENNWKTDTKLEKWIKWIWDLGG